MTLSNLNLRFAIPGHVSFDEIEKDFIIAKINNTHATSRIALQGAHIMTFQPNGEKPVIWLSEDAKFVSGKSIRGGVPICWPWFGPHETNPDFPAHGFARTMDWEVQETKALPDGSTLISFYLPVNDTIKKQWPHSFKLEIHITIGKTIKIELETNNTGKEPFTISEALHTYFHISDIQKIKISGLEGSEYMDKVGTPARKKQSGAITIDNEVDRVYLNTSSACLIEDQDWHRAIRIKKSGSQSTVVWNPWLQKAEKMGDLGQDGYRRMVCIESANALDNKLLVNTEHKLIVEYSVEKI